MTRRWTFAWAAVLAALAVMPFPVLNGGVGALSVVVIMLALASIVMAGVVTRAVDAVVLSVHCDWCREEQHRRGAFRRQHAPDTPGRPGRPRAPGRTLSREARQL